MVWTALVQRRTIKEGQGLDGSIVMQGSPLNPQHLEMVSVRSAGTTIILSDASRAAREQDAQSLRASVMIDDLFDSDEARGNILVELKSGHSARMVSPRAFA